ncbi:MAG: type II toxin-antitoxin system VapC family toxin [Beijerinckiaceae bacterium]|nr:type II toxin-antitoxin system VapC family toxin [Beijerinckiaceae bacterium]
MYLLDTNVVSELRNLRIAEPAVIAWSRQHNGDHFFLSAVTVFELERGALRALRRDERKGTMLRSWINDYVLPIFKGRILTFDVDVALRCAAMHMPDPRPERDSMIAATASIHGLTVATRNVADFEACGVPVFNPWLYPA